MGGGKKHRQRKGLWSVSRRLVTAKLCHGVRGPVPCVGWVPKQRDINFKIKPVHRSRLLWVAQTQKAFLEVRAATVLPSLHAPVLVKSCMSRCLANIFALHRFGVQRKRSPFPCWSCGAKSCSDTALSPRLFSFVRSFVQSFNRSPLPPFSFLHYRLLLCSSFHFSPRLNASPKPTMPPSCSFHFQEDGKAIPETTKVTPIIPDPEPQPRTRGKKPPPSKTIGRKPTVPRGTAAKASSSSSSPPSGRKPAPGKASAGRPPAK